MNLLYGFQDSLELLAFRWRLIRKRGTQIAITAVFIVVAFLVFGLTSVGGTIRIIASNPTPQIGDQVRQLALTYIDGFISDNAIFAITGVLAAIIGSILIIPIVGYSFSSLMPSGDLVSVRKNDYHKLSDSIILQFLSSISLIQLVAITMLNSLLTIESHSPGVGIVFGWVIWIAVVIANVLAAWVFELLYRIFGFKSKVLAFASLGVIGGILYLVFPKSATTLFGLSTAYGNLIRGLDTFSIGQTALLGAISVAILVFLFAGISAIGSYTINLPERPKKAKVRRVRVLSVGRKRASISEVSFLLNIIFRNSNIWKPLLMATAFSFGSVLLFAGAPSVMSSLVFVVPLIVSLSWGTNTFGILGGGITWIASLPGGKEDILKNILKVQFMLIGSLFLIIVTPMIFIYHVSLHSLASFALATAVSTVAMSRSALSKAVYKPERYKVHIKGENVLPPGKALSYLARFIFGAGFLGLATFALDNNLYQLGILAIVVIWQSIRFVRLNKRWNDNPQVIENVIRTVGY